MNVFIVVDPCMGPLDFPSFLIVRLVPPCSRFLLLKATCCYCSTICGWLLLSRLLQLEMNCVHLDLVVADFEQLTFHSVA